MEKNTAETAKALEAMREINYAMSDLTYKMEKTAIAARKAGATWNQIGEVLGLTKQRAQQKYGPAVEQTQRMEEWAAANPVEAAAARARGVENHRQRMIQIEAEAAAEVAAAKLAADDDQTPTTASIFSDTPAPAKRKTPSKKVDAPAPATLTVYRKRYNIPGAKSTDTAQPGTGKGQHQCRNCGDTNHKTEDNTRAAFNMDCEPTKYDPPKIAALIKRENGQ